MSPIRNPISINPAMMREKIEQLLDASDVENVSVIDMVSTAPGEWGLDLAGRKNVVAELTLTEDAVIIVSGLVAGAGGYIAVSQDNAGGHVVAVADGQSITALIPDQNANSQTLLAYISVDGERIFVRGFKS